MGRHLSDGGRVCAEYSAAIAGTSLPSTTTDEAYFVPCVFARGVWNGGGIRALEPEDGEKRSFVALCQVCGIDRFGGVCLGASRFGGAAVPSAHFSNINMR